ncbi:hypothetical protein FHR71_005271 [Methylobacterium sp. RAS18]|nr:hypothetical protein [Methylobacterium sp. RAS18]
MTIRTDAEHQEALARLDEMTGVMRTRSFSDAESAEFDMLVGAIQAYKATRFALGHVSSEGSRS